MPQNLANILSSNWMMIAAVIVMILLMIVPQNNSRKKTKEMLGAMKKGDFVRTIGGVVGKITDIRGEVVTIETGPDKIQLDFVNGAIAATGEQPNTSSHEEKK